MSKDEDKFKHSKRLLKDENAVKKQVKIAKEHGVPIKDSHKFAKQHALNCGNPKCILCANPRKTFNELTLQERRMFQDIDKETDKHSNGLKNDKE
jgi:7-cyano-7-deazaguanine synthase in queuosine biosynthesis